MLPAERIEAEFMKFLLKGKFHRLALKEFQKTGWLDLFPEIASLHNLPQDPEHHPEGDVLTHTGLCLEALRLIPDYQSSSPLSKKILSLATLCHDLGKSTTTTHVFDEKLQRTKIMSPNHQIEGLIPTASLLKKLNQPPKTIQNVCLLVKHHMDHIWTDPSPSNVAALAAKLSPTNPHAPSPTLCQSISTLAILVEADLSGREPNPKGLPNKMKVLAEKAAELGCLNSPLKNPITGSDLIQNGFTPGKIFDSILKALYLEVIDRPSLSQSEALNILKAPEALLKKSGECPPPLLNAKTLMAMGVPPNASLGIEK